MSVPRSLFQETLSSDELYDVIVALLYSRVSTDDQATKGVSLPEQESANRAYVAKRQRWTIGGEFQDIQSGLKPSRDGYQAMLHEIRRLKTLRQRVVVVVKFQDRLGRDFEESIRVYFALVKLGVEVHVVDRNGAPSEDEFFLRAYIAYKEAQAISKRVSDNVKFLEAQGWHKPGGPAWGYKLRKATEAERAAKSPIKVHDLDEATAAYAKEAWERFAGGESVRKIATWVQTLPPEARGQTDEKRARDLSFNAVRKLLMAPVYVARHGHMDPADPDGVLDRPKGRWPALIDDDTWRRASAQRRLARRMPKQASGDYLLTGLIRCSRCGGRMGGRATLQKRPKGAKRREYCCTAKLNLGAKNADRRCSMTLAADAIERPVLDHFVGMLRAAGNPSMRQRIMREVARQEQAEAGEPVGRKIKALEAARGRALGRLDALADSLADGVMDGAEYARQAARHRAAKDAAEQELVALRGRVRETHAAPVALLLPNCAGWAEALERAEGPALREVLSRFVVTVAPVRVAYGRYSPDYRLTTVGETVLAGALIALREERGEAERGLYRALLEVDNLAKARWSTSTSA
jgi:DNA invertase Pin-like site-specific DNA recombinase